MNGYRFVRQYVGGVKALIFDWSGTTADRYVIAPAIAFVEVFQKYGVPISMAEARLPMGIRKDLHIKAIIETESVQQRWKNVHGKFPVQADIDRMYQDFIPMQLDILPKYSELLPGTAETVEKLRKDYCLKIGSTTGFNRSMVDVLLRYAKQQGYIPDVTVAGDEVIHGARPKPFMIYRNMDLLDVHPIQSVVKVDDTVSGIVEALEAGCWGIGIARYSNYMDIDSFEQEKRLTEENLSNRLKNSRKLLTDVGAHYVIDSIIELPDVIRNINQRLAQGEKP